ncbi:MAG: DNA alkylation repair protein [Puniceicoccales bacterium]|jgi:3-methyladenine DNA glycosylase AlkD|nr:DNA alkylation repair protein [Puniceicoccales bacterium]
MVSNAIELIGEEMQALADPVRASFSRKLLRLGSGSGRLLLGCSMADLRRICKQRGEALSLEEISILLRSDCQEFRQLALLAMVSKFKATPEAIVRLYLDSIAYVDNWDLVDLSAPKIIGAFYGPGDKIFMQLASSPNLWANRIAIVATLPFIRDDQFALTLRLAEMFMGHWSHFLHKASGWMLREVGKRDVEVLLTFLKERAPAMPKIMLRYACERLSEEQKSKLC